MPFCPNGHGLLLPKNEFRCDKCGYAAPKPESKTIKHAREEREILVLDDEAQRKLEVMPTMRVECPKCGHFEAYFRTQQTRKSDEPETTFLRCVKCDHRWRKY